MPASCKVVVAGHICLDIIPTIFQERIEFTPNRMLEVGPAVLSTGGAVSNTGLALHKLGITTQLMGKVGKDSFGAVVREIVAKHEPSLTEGMHVAGGEATSYTVIISSPSQDRMFLHCPGCNNTFGADDIDYAMLHEAGLFHFGYPPVMRRVIEDDGRGFDPAAPPSNGGPTFGLQIMRERAEEAGGTFQVCSAPGLGTRVILHVPADRGGGA